MLTAVQLLWVNLIMDTFAALALGMFYILDDDALYCLFSNIVKATDPPTPHLLNRRPEPKSAPLISATMWKMMIGQSIYQLVVTFVLNFAGKPIFNHSIGDDRLNTVVFNTFVWMQIFNQWK